MGFLRVAEGCGGSDPKAEARCNSAHETPRVRFLGIQGPASVPPVNPVSPRYVGIPRCPVSSGIPVTPSPSELRLRHPGEPRGKSLAPEGERRRGALLSCPSSRCRRSVSAGGAPREVFVLGVSINPPWCCASGLLVIVLIGGWSGLMLKVFSFVFWLIT